MTVVPGTIFGPWTDIPTVIPLAPPPKVNVLCDGQSAAVVSVTPLKPMTVVGDTPLPKTGALSVTVIVVTLVLTVVPVWIPAPLTGIPEVISSVPGVATKVIVGPDVVFALGNAVMDALAEPNAMGVVVVTPAEETPVLSVTVVMLTVAVTVVPGAMLVPLTSIPTPIPIAIP